MKDDVRVRIDSHRLMRAASAEVNSPSVDAASARSGEGLRSGSWQLFLRAGVHLGVFVFAYLITAGAALIGVILAVRPDNLLALVLLAVCCAVLFVVSFAGMRYGALHHLLDLYPDKGEDPGSRYHIGKSIAYAFLALVLAVLLTGFLLNTATATPASRMVSM